jgi:hypothetical protein
MNTTYTNTTKPLTTAQQKSVATGFLSNKRKAIGLFKTMNMSLLSALNEQIADILKSKVEEAANLARIKQQEKQAIDSAVNKTMAHLESLGLKFNKEEVSRLLSDKVKLGKAQVINPELQMNKPSTIVGAENELTIFQQV